MQQPTHNREARSLVCLRQEARSLASLLLTHCWRTCYVRRQAKLNYPERYVHLPWEEGAHYKCLCFLAMAELQGRRSVYRNRYRCKHNA